VKQYTNYIDHTFRETPQTRFENVIYVEVVIDILRVTSFSIAQPIMMRLQQIGNVLAPLTGQKLYPTFPALPTTTVEDVLRTIITF